MLLTVRTVSELRVVDQTVYLLKRLIANLADVFRIDGVSGSGRVSGVVVCVEGLHVGQDVLTNLTQQSVANLKKKR